MGCDLFMSGKMKVCFLEVGHGDSTVITYPDGVSASIIDTPDPRITFDYIIENKIQFIDWVIISHGDSDHYNGIASLINNLYAENIYVKKLGYIRGDKILRRAKGYTLLRQQFVEFQDKLGIETIEPYSSTIPVLTQIDGMKMECLYPCYAADVDSAGDDSNNWSIVIKVEHSDKSVLLTGDLEGQGWYRMKTHSEKKGTKIQSDILKLPHHGRWFSGGSNALSLEEVIKLVSAQIFIVSAGYSRRLSCPSKETVDLIKKYPYKKRILCTGCGTACHNGDEILNIPSDISLGRSRFNSILPCAGNVTVEINEGNLNLFPTREDHNTVMDQLKHPICREIG